MDNKNRLREVIRQIVREEIYHIVPSLLKEALVDVLAETPTAAPPRRKVTARPITEAVRTPPAKKFSSAQLRAAIGYGDDGDLRQEYDVPPGARRAGEPPIVFRTPGTDVNPEGTPINPDMVHDYAIEAVTKDYSALMARMREMGKL